MALLSGLVNRVRPSRSADGTNVLARQGRYGEVMVVPITLGTYGIADEGSYFKATNPTPGTGIAAAITAAYSATAAYINVRNTDAAGGKRMYFDYLTLLNTVVPATSTSVQLVVTIDNPGTARYASGGSLIAGVNANMDDTTASVANIHAGAVVLNAASGSARMISRGVLKGAIPVVNDTLMIQFGNAGNIGGALTGGPIGVTDDVGPVVVGPQQDLNVHIYYPGNATTAGQWEFEFGWWER